MKNLIRISDERSNLLDVVFLNVPPNIREITLRCTSLQHVLVGGEQVSFSAKAQDPGFARYDTTTAYFHDVNDNSRSVKSNFVQSTIYNKQNRA